MVEKTTKKESAKFLNRINSEFNELLINGELKHSALKLSNIKYFLEIF